METLRARWFSESQADLRAVTPLLMVQLVSGAWILPQTAFFPIYLEEALQRGQVCGFDAGAYDTLVRPGPRLGDAAEAIADCLVRLGTMPP